MGSLYPETFRQRRRGRFGEPYLYARECASTQELLHDPSLPEGAVAVADHQTSGRGRLGRAWEDAAGGSLLCSVLLRPDGGALPQLSLVTALATAEAIDEVTGLATHVKWPNDVLLDGRKVSGILLEAIESRVVAGIGINVNQTEEELPARTRLAPGSLLVATGRRHDRADLLATLLLRLELAYDAWCSRGLDAVRGALDARSALRGHAVRVDGKAGVAGGLAPGGGLEVVLRSGETVVIESGEVELLELGGGVDVG
jgi:BirA family biotin operon repressor/biotin-[acetyl-CoA-carboxylase] ligase